MISKDKDYIDYSAGSFVLKLSDAIQAFLDDLTQEDAYALYYRGSCLKRVFQCWLYFLLVNDQDLYKCYVEKKRGDAPLNIFSERILPFLLHLAPKEKKRILRLKIKIRKLINTFVSLAHGVAGKPFSRFTNHARMLLNRKESRQKVLIHVGAIKFLRYLEPIAHRLGDSAYYGTIDNPQLAESISNSGARVINISITRGKEPEGYLTEIMKSWRSTWEEFDSIYYYLKNAGFTKIVLAEGNSPENEILACVARALSIRVICIQQGWSPLVHCGFRDMNYDAMCVWGNEFARTLHPYNPNQTFFISGHHLLELNDDPKMVQKSAIGFFLQKGSPLITEAAWQAMLDLILWTAQKFPQTAILVREHPGAPLSDGEVLMISKYQNIKLVPAHETNLESILAQCRVAISIFSTTLIEAAVSQTIPLILNVTGMARYNPDLEALGAGIEVKNFSDAQKALLHLMQDEQTPMLEAMRGVETRFCAARGGAALDLILRVIHCSHLAECKDFEFHETSRRTKNG